MKIQRIFHLRYHEQTSIYREFGTTRRSFGSFGIANKRQLLTQYRTTAAKIFNLPALRQSPYPSLREKLLPVVAVLPVIRHCNFPLINSLASTLSQRPIIHSVLDRKRLLSSRYRSVCFGISEIIPCLNKTYLHNSCKKMVWPTEHDLPQNGSEVFFVSYFILLLPRAPSTKNRFVCVKCMCERVSMWANACLFHEIPLELCVIRAALVSPPFKINCSLFST